MSLVFVVRSEDQFSTGTPWCKVIAETMGCRIHLLVVGKDRKTMAEYIRRKAEEALATNGIKPQVELVGENVSELVSHLEAVSCKVLLIIHRRDDSTFQQQLFQTSMAPTIIVSAKQGPPQSTDQVASLFRRPSMVSTIVSEILFGFTPSSFVCENNAADDLANEAATTFDSNPKLEGKLVLCGVEELTASDPFYKAGLALLDHESGVSVALVHNGHSYAETMASIIRQWAASIAPPMDRDQRTELADDLRLGSKPNLEFLGLMSAAAMLASFGLLQNSGAVVIGAMLIAPLMTPILGAGLALAQGNKPLFQSAILTVILGFVGALVSSLLFGWLCLFFDSFDMLFKTPEITPEMWARCKPSPLDFCVGLVGGVAASYARTRRHLSSALAGAAIAAALVPPIATAGLQIAFGSSYWNDKPDGVPIWGPLHLVAINVVTIMIGSAFVLWARGMRSERTLALKDRWAIRMGMLLMLALLALIWVLRPES